MPPRFTEGLTVRSQGPASSRQPPFIERNSIWLRMGISPKVFVFLIVFLLLIHPPASVSGGKKKRLQTKRQILVYAQRVDDQLQSRIREQIYKNAELDYVLGELHIDATPNSEVAVVLEDSMTLSDVKTVPAMAMKAGFTEVRAFVYWKGSGNMAEVLFGPVTKVKRKGYIE